MKVTALRVENVKGLKSLEIEPGDRHLIVIGGENGAGKSTALDCIEWALRGQKAVDAEPLRDGEKRGGFELELAADPERGLPAIIIKGIFRKGKPPQLKLERADGLKQAKPQTLLDSLYNQAAFDPQWFAGLKPAEQAKVLRELVGLDFAELDAKRAGLFAERTGVNRDVKAMEARLKAADHFPNAPAEEVSVVELMAELQRADETNQANERERRRLGELVVSAEAHAALLVSRQGAVTAAKEALAKAEQSLVNAVDKQAILSQQVETTQAEVDALQDIDTAPIQHRIAESETVNRQVRANRDQADLKGDLGDLESRAVELSANIEAIDQTKIEQLESADWPVSGLGFDEDGVTYQGRPLGQASNAERHRICAAIGVGLSPTPPVLLLREASLLDSKSLEAVCKVAREAKGQVWAEVVTAEVEDCDVLIENGVIKQGESDDNGD